MRLIDADALVAKVCELATEISLEVMDAPTIDAVEVVRCKDCEFCEKRHTANWIPFLYCIRTNYSVSEKSFCSWGEKMDGEEDC